jgi:SAM-dependent methyltransferase
MPQLGELAPSIGRRLTRAVRRRAGARRAGHVAPQATEAWDWWLDAASGPRLRDVDAACAAGGPECFALFRGLDTDVWALLLTQLYTSYPNIRRLLPDMPDTALQTRWNGASGAALASQGAAFYRCLRARFRRFSPVSLDDATVLDFGCGWGRLTRFLARDVAPARLYGCDPSRDILDVCRITRVPATLARSDHRPDRVPFDVRFDLAFAFSVFTHLSEPAHEACLRALHAALRPGGILVATIRPPAYLDRCDAMQPLRTALAPGLEHPAYLFVPHAADPAHPQYDGGELSYGETVVTLRYVGERWAPRFELLATDLLLDDPFQVVLTLRRA